jgi:FMN phosphatase YigB (HAD superfamily)
MALTLEQYAAYLDTRRDLSWPAPPVPSPAKARPHLTPLEDVRCVLWNIYGTLLCIPGGELWFEHKNAFVMGLALEKIIQEFKMWASMSRHPGQPSEYLHEIYKQVFVEQSHLPGGGERFPEILAENLWAEVVKKLCKKDYKFDVGFFGSLNEMSKKLAYFFHSSLQGMSCYEGAAAAMQHIADKGLSQGLFGDGQCFTHVQLKRGIAAQNPDANTDSLLTEGLSFLSCDFRARKPSERFVREVSVRLSREGIAPSQVLHVSSRVALDLLPARKLGMKTALFAGDRESLQATPELLKDPVSRPDVLLTELSQITEVIG